MQLYARIDGMTAAQASDLARSYAERLEHDDPQRVTSRMTKSLRPEKVFVDWSQNNPAKTTVAPYSLRARPEPTASTPLTWDEVEAGGALRFTAPEVLARVDRFGDLWAATLDDSLRARITPATVPAE